MITHLVLSLYQPDSSVEPFFNSVVKQLGIPDVFSLQMCGAGLSASSTADPAGGSLVSSLEVLSGTWSDQTSFTFSLYSCSTEAVNMISTSKTKTVPTVIKHLVTVF